MISKIKSAFSGDIETRKKVLRYLAVGGFNTIFGYCFSVGLYYSAHDYFHIVLIGLFANIICITEAFIMYKLFVFNTHGRWLNEYFKSFVVYAGSAVFGIFGLWLLVEIMSLPFWLAQGLLLIISVAISFLGHNFFTFKRV